MERISKLSKIPLALAFLIALLEMPYGYYELLRTVAMVLFIVYGINSYNKKEGGWTFFWFGSALLINPIVKIALGRIIWNIVDVIWAITLFYRSRYN